MYVLTEKNAIFLSQILRIVVFFNQINSNMMLVWTRTVSRVGCSSQVVSTDLSMNAECLSVLTFLPRCRSPPSCWWLSWRFWPLQCSSARGLSERGNNKTLMAFHSEWAIKTSLMERKVTSENSSKVSLSLVFISSWTISLILYPGRDKFAALKSSWSSSLLMNPLLSTSERKGQTGQSFKKPFQTEPIRWLEAVYTTVMSLNAPCKCKLFCNVIQFSFFWSCCTALKQIAESFSTCESTVLRFLIKPLEITG